MTIQLLSFIFYIYLLILAIASLCVILSKNTMHSVLFLVLVFFLSSVLLFLVGAEFLAIILLIVYVGAISILFLFVVMLLNLRIVELHNTFLNYLPIGSFIGFFFFFELGLLLSQDFDIQESSFFFDDFSHDLWMGSLFTFSNLKLFGFMLYNYCGFLIIIVSFILLISMVGVILLTSGFDSTSARMSYIQNKELLDKSINLTL